MSSTSRYIVRKLNTRGAVVFSYDAELAERLSDGVRLDALWTQPPLLLGYTTFETGDHFTEWYYTDRWYNIFAIHAVDGTLKGWYCNIAEPATITTDSVTWRDLLLDLWVSPEGQTQVLDEEEFAADTALDAATRAAAERALAELIERVQVRHAPFDGLP
ncbi:MAG TPA: DUF402 domain-containing protein, partial [Ktedonobacterales bacterium]|nr:DUF402 domain-containing protein [Ktedonobacterales bacterium]